MAAKNLVEAESETPTPEAGNTEENQLIVDNIDEEKKKRQEEVAAKLDAFNKPDPNVFEAYKYIIWLRQSATTKFYKERDNKQKTIVNERSKIAKCGSLMKTLIVYCIIAAFAIPMLKETYHKAVGDGQSIRDYENDIITIDKEGKDSMSKEDIAKRAQEREAEEMRKFDEKMRKMEEEMGINEDQAPPSEDDDDLMPK